MTPHPFAALPVGNPYCMHQEPNDNDPLRSEFCNRKVDHPIHAAPGLPVDEEDPEQEEAP